MKERGNLPRVSAPETNGGGGTNFHQGDRFGRDGQSGRNGVKAAAE